MDISILDYLIAFVAAFVAGFMDAIIGGGGLITLPIVLGLGIPIQLAVATTKLQASMAALSAVYSLRKEINFKELKLGIFLAALFSVLGSFTLINMSSDFLKPLVLIILISVFLYTLFKPDLGQIERSPKLNLVNFLIIFSPLLGFYDGFFGPGTGSFWIFAFVLMLGINIKQASINTKVLNTTSNLCSLLFFIIFYDVLFKFGLFMGIGGMIGAYLGGKCLLKVRLDLIKKAFVIIVFFTICKLIYSYIF